MKKKYLKLAVAVLSFFVITNITSVNALTTEEQDTLDSMLSSYDDSKPNCIYEYYNTQNAKLYCFSSDNTPSSCSSGSNYFYCTNVAPFRINLSKYGVNTYQYSSNSSVYLYTPGDNDFSEISVYSNFNFTDSSNRVNIGSFSIGAKEKYIITFIPPKGTTIEVKDSNNEIVQPTSQYVYELEAGTYNYSATNNLYISLENISFEVSDTDTINVEMQSKVNNPTMRSIYSQYYTYISQLVSNLFQIDNPLFLFLVSFIIGFSLLVFIKRLIGGRY